MLSLPYHHKKYLTFDTETQSIRFVDGGWPDKSILEYKKENGEFDGYKFYIDYLTSVHKIISTLEPPNALGLTMDPLSTVYHPCLVCMNTEWSLPQSTRCYHQPDCPIEDNKHMSSCGCKLFTHPSLTHSKIGTAVLKYELLIQTGLSKNF